MFLQKGRCKNIPVELHPLLQSFEGYPRSNDYAGGNDLLYALSAISNPNKHTETYTIGLDMGGGGIINRFQADIVLELAFPPKFNPETHELVLFTTDPTGNYKVDMGIPAYIAFGEVPIVARRPVLPVLNEMTHIAEGIVLSIEAETARILQKRNP